MDRIKLLKLYKESLRTGIIDDEILLYLINDEIEKNGYQDYVKEISFKENSNVCGYYNPIEKKIYIQKDIEDVKSKSKEKLVMSKYLVILGTIYHELTHVKQDKRYRECLKKCRNKIAKSDYSDIIKSKIYSCEISLKDLYKKLHDYFPSEHEAVFMGNYMKINKAEEIEFIPKLSEEIKKEFFIKYLFNNYELSYNYVLSPFEHIKDYIDSEEYAFIANEKILTSYEKLVMGLPMKKDEFVYVKRILKNSSSFEEGIKRI